jgi:hypothetical protein
MSIQAEPTRPASQMVGFSQKSPLPCPRIGKTRGRRSARRTRPPPSVEHLTQRRVAVAAAGELRHVARDGALRVEATLAHQTAHEHAAQRLRDRHQQVARGGSHPVPIALDEDVAPAQHEDPIGAAPLEPIVDLELDRRGAEPKRRAVAARHRDRRQDGVDVLERPAVRRSVQPALGRGAGHDAVAAEGVAARHPSSRIPSRPSRAGSRQRARVGSRTRVPASAAGVNAREF